MHRFKERMSKYKELITTINVIDVFYSFQKSNDQILEIGHSQLNLSP